MKRIIPIIGILFIFAIIFFGFRLRDRINNLELPPIPGLEFTAPSLGIDINEIKPSQWQLYNKRLIQLSIDDDEEMEWMMFYLYDGHNIGGIIYDPQPTPLGNEGIALPDQSATFLVPYRLLPDYQFNKTNGYLGDDKVDYRTAISDPSSEPVAPDRLLVRGIDHKRITRFSVFWWISEQFGYGGAHASTSGWFSLSHDQPNDWERWRDPVAPINELWAWEPLHDRSNLCRRLNWHLIEGDKALFTRRFEASAASDITFCNGELPADPAFPEAQVLAYIKDGDGKRLWQSDNDQFPRYNSAVVDAISAPLVLDRVSPDEYFYDVPIRVEIDVDFTIAGMPYATRWTVAMVRPDSIRETTRWRIVNVGLRQ